MQFKKEDYPYKTLEKLGYKRANCKFCGKFFGVNKKEIFVMMMNAELRQD